jgi:hypothetical protein
MSQEFESRKQRRVAELLAQAELLANPQAPQQATQAPLQSENRFDSAGQPPQAPLAAPNLSRRELRQRLAVEPALPSAAPVQIASDNLANLGAASFSAPSASRRDLREQLRQPDEFVDQPISTPVPQPDDAPQVQMFQTSSGFSLDTTTNSIVLPVAPDALSGPLVIDTGVTLRTGSIPLPNLNTATGSIPLPQVAQIADEAQRLDSSSTFVSSISPVAAQNLIRQNPKLGFAPIKSTPSHGQLFYGLTTAILMLTVGGLLVVAWMYGLI